MDDDTLTGPVQTTHPRQHRKVLSAEKHVTTSHSRRYPSLPTRLANLYHLPELPPPGPATLTGDVAHHLARVLRVRIDDQVMIGDGRGQTATASITGVQKQVVSVVVADVQQHGKLTPLVTLAFAVPKPSRADWLVEHATEVGVTTFQPLWTERSRPQGLRAERWRKVAAAAAGQCARAWLPEVHEPIELQTLLSGHHEGERLLADTNGEPMVMAEGSRCALLLVGPEGGFSPAERAAAQAAQFRAVRFGAHILRTETAALVGAAVLLRNAH